MKSFSLDIHIPRLHKFLDIVFEDRTRKDEPKPKRQLKIKHSELPENRKEDATN